MFEQKVRGHCGGSPGCTGVDGHERWKRLEPEEGQPVALQRSLGVFYRMFSGMGGK